MHTTVILPEIDEIQRGHRFQDEDLVHKQLKNAHCPLQSGNDAKGLRLVHDLNEWFVSKQDKIMIMVFYPKGRVSVRNRAAPGDSAPCKISF